MKPNNGCSLLVIDDEASIRELLQQELEPYGFQVSVSPSGEDALMKMAAQKFDAAVCDVKMPAMDGVETLVKMKEADPGMAVIMITGYASVETAVNAMKSGAFDYVVKPFDIAHLVKKIQQALEQNELKTLNALYESSQLLFSSMKMEDILNGSLDIISRVLGADDASIFLLDDQHKLALAACNGAAKRLEIGTQIEIGEKIAGRAVELKKEYLINGSLDTYPEFQHLKSNPNIHSSIVAPMLVKDEAVGVLCLSRGGTSKPFSETSLKNAAIFAAQIGQAAANAKLYKKIRIYAAEAEAAREQLSHIQDQLIQAEKLAALGRLVSGIAHEINNPMTAILGFSQLLLEKHRGTELAPQMEIIYQEADRCRKIVKDLSAFARKRKPDLKSIDLQDVIARAVDSCRETILKSGAKVTVPERGAALNAMGDTQQLEEVFRNLLINACHAVEQTSGSKSICIEHERTAAHHELKVIDNGVGIAEEEMKKIFEPFFSTKGVGGGTGLGLSLASGIVQAHGGSLTADSKLGVGTTFKVRVPKLHEETPAAPAKPEKSILIVEDEPAIVIFMKSLLENQGYQTDSAANGAEAMTKLQANQYDLVICDFRMPRMDGKMLFEKLKMLLKEKVPRFLFVTGYIDSDEDTRFLEKNKLDYLLKPFTRESLLSAVKEEKRGAL